MLKEIEFEEFYKNKRILITGHTGFKGAWLCQILTQFGADVSGYSLMPPTEPNLFGLTEMNQKIRSYIGDIRNLSALQEVFNKEKPEIVIHMAAQPIVRESYKDPVGTYASNVMGTVHVLECVRKSTSVKSIINVTTDKVYRNNEWDKGYVETDYLDGFDPYSNSKSCSELVTHSYINSFLKGQNVSVSTCRAGNVIGGGDFAIDRIIPDCIRAVENKRDIVVRSPYSIRPYQHVLEPLFVYLMIAMEQYKNPQIASCYNVGPDDINCVTTGELVSAFCDIWNKGVDSDGLQTIKWVNFSDNGPHEANFLKLDCTKLKQTFQWTPQWSICEAIKKVINFEKIRIKNQDNAELICMCMNQQIAEYLRTSILY